MANILIRLFDKEFLQDLLWDEPEGYEILENEMIGTSRWSIQYNLVFKELDSGKIYETQYRRGATEQQDEKPFEYSDDEVECVEVEPVEVVTIKFKPVLA